MAANNTDVPEDYVLVKKSDLSGLKKLDSAITALYGDIEECKKDVDRITSNRKAFNKRVQDKPVLIAKFEDICRNSKLRSDIETVRSECTNKLKHKVADLDRKQTKSKKDLKKRFQDGTSELNKAYKNELVKNFQNKTATSNVPPVEQYASEELLKTYRECMEQQLLPKMDALYRNHCQKMDQALKSFVQRYTASVGGETQLSPEVQNKLTMINRRIDQMKNNSATRQTRINESVNRVTQQMSELHVQPREPVAPTAQEQIQECLDREEFHLALNQALMAIDVELLLDTLSKLNIEDVFGDQPPSQPDLLALLSQLPNDLHLNLQLKAEFLNETVQAIDLEHEIILAHREPLVRLLTILLDNIDTAREHVTPRDFQRNLKNLRWATLQIISQLP